MRRADPERDRQLTELWFTSLPERLLEIRLGRPSSSFYRRARELGLPSRIAIRERRDGMSFWKLKKMKRLRKEGREAWHK